MTSSRRSNKQENLAPRYHNRIVGLFTGKSYVLFISIIAIILAISSWQIRRSYMCVRTVETQLEQLIRLDGTAKHRDEVLAMSAKMAAATQELSWVSRHKEFSPRGWCFPGDGAVNAGSILMVSGENKLDTMEHEALDLVRQGKHQDAETLLQSPEYQEQRHTYNKRMKAFISHMRKTLEDRRDKHWQKVREALEAVSIALPVVALAWFVAHKRRKSLRRRAETKQKFSAFAREWQETFNAITDGVCIVDKSGGKILQCNSAMTRFLKRPYNEIIGRSCCELFHDSSEPARRCPLVRMYETRRSETQDFQIHDKWLNVKVDPLIDNDRNLVGAVHIISDITEQRKANRALQDGENKFRLAFANAQDAIVWIDVGSGTIVNCNKAAEELFGKSRKEIVGQHHTTLYPAENAEHYHSLLVQSGKTPKSNIEAEILTGSGKRRTVTIAVSTMDVDRKEIVQGIIRDITKQKRAEKQKIELELQLSQRQKMDAIGTLAGGIAHDFNNILAAMQGYLELSLDDISDESAVRDHLGQILSCVNRATKLVRQILTFSRKNDQDDEEEKEHVQISSIVKEVHGMLRSSLPATIKFNRKIEADSSVVMADPTQIHQVLVNLCTNASHAMCDAGGLLEVILRDVDLESETRIGDELLGPGPYVKISVSDSGCGMDKEVLERIFEPFFTTRKVNEGTGLGLSVVHGIIKSHDGAIAVSSTPGKGTTFDIFLPKIESNEIQESQPSEPTTKEKEVILLVDDEEMMVDVTKQILGRLGFDVIAKTSSIDALETFQEEPDKFDLVITDQVMPNMTGTQLAEKLISIRSDIPIILCSGFPENVSPDQLKSIGIREFIAKPVTRQEIAKTIQRVLSKSGVTA